MKWTSAFWLVCVLWCVPGCRAATTAKKDAPRLRFEVKATLPHDKTAFTEGFFWRDGAFYESTGLHGHSTLRKVAPQSGKVLLRRNLPSDVFGEGIAWLNNTIVQLSWEKGLAYVYDAHTFKLLKTWHYKGQGWGLTTDGKSYIASDGSDVITWRDAQTFAPIKKLSVTWNGHSLYDINELEWINGEIWANVWHKPWVMQIDPHSGKVLSYIDISSLIPAEADSEDVANGIAWNAKSGHIFLTGKRWPVVYEIAVVK